MSFQIYFRDMRHGGEGTSVCVADSLEEFRNTTVEELKRKLIPEDQLEDTILLYRCKTLKKNRTLGFYNIKHDDHIYAVRRRMKPKTSYFPVTRAKNIKLDNYDLKPLEDDHTLGSGIKHEDDRSAATASSGFFSPPSRRELAAPKYLNSSFSHNFFFKQSASSGVFKQTVLRKLGRITHSPEDEHEHEDKVIPRSQSMDNLLMMHQPQLEPSE